MIFSKQCCSKFVIEKLPVPDGSNSNGTTKQKTYKQTYTNADLGKQLLSFYELPIGASLSAFCKGHTIPKSSFHRHFKESGLSNLQALEKPLEMAKATLVSYFLALEKNSERRTETASEANCYLTTQQELAIVQIAKLLGMMGEGITRLDIHRMILEVLNLNEDERTSYKCSEKVVDRLLKNNRELVKLVSAGSLDPARAKKANEQTRDAMFKKLDAYIRNLYAMKRIPWKRAKKLPRQVIYNMDEVGTDTTKRRAKVIASAEEMMRHFQITPEGDGKMNMHITACITTRADGKSRLIDGGGGERRLLCEILTTCFLNRDFS
jgi:hypothetical protein